MFMVTKLEEMERKIAALDRSGNITSSTLEALRAKVLKLEHLESKVAVLESTNVISHRSAEEQRCEEKHVTVSAAINEAHQEKEEVETIKPSRISTETRATDVSILQQEVDHIVHREHLRGVVQRVPGGPNRFAQDSTRVHHSYMSDICPEEYQFNRSLWDAALFVGNEVFSTSTSIFLSILFIGMLVALIVLCGIVLQNFTDFDAFNQETQDQYKYWRLRESHLLKYANQVTGTSMVSRVCNQDESLLLASDQKRTVNALLEYYPGSGLIDSVLCGPVLCILALSVWYMTIIVEILGILQLFRVMKSARATSETDSFITHEGFAFHFRKISSCRALYGLLLMLLRLVVSVLLLLSGTCYIVHTIEIEEMLLNCVALEIILNLDELMFQCLAPAQVRDFINHLQPVEVPPWPRIAGVDLTSATVSTFLVGGLVIARFIYMEPFWDKLNTVFAILCEGHVDFLVQPDAVGIGYVTTASPFGSEATIREALFADAVDAGTRMSVEDLVHQGFALWGGVGWEPSKNYQVEQNLESLRSKMNEEWFHDLRHYQHWQTAEGKSATTISGRIDSPLKFLRGLLKNDTTTCDNLHRVGEFDLGYFDRSCYLVLNHHTSTVASIRALCPYGCGCYTPWFGTIFKHEGCPVDAITSDTYQQQLAHFPCENPHVHLNSSIMSWIRQWKVHAELALHMSPSEIASMREPELPEFCYMVYAKLGMVETMAPAICPVDFGCKYNNYSTPSLFPVRIYCPTSCRTTTTTTI